MNKGIHILVVEDDANMLKTLSDILSEESYIITGVGSIKSAREELKHKFYNLALVDLKLADGSGLELLKEIKELNEETMSIVLTGFASIESAVSAMNQGAFSYLQKPLNMEELKISIKKALKMQELSSSNKNLIARLQDLSLKDQLTGLYNYRYLRERISSEFKRAKRYVFPLSLIILDIDYLKSINDTYGYQYGDLIIKEFTQELLKNARGNDVAIRYGGDEFIVILPDTDKKGAMIFAKRLFSALTEHAFDQKNNRIKLKVSIGISSFPECRVSTEQGFLDSADQALRGAKERGGNRLVVFKSKNEQELEAFDEAYQRETGDSGRIDNGSGMRADSPFADLFDRIGGCYQESCPVFAHVSRAKQTLTLYLNGRAVDVWPVSTGVEGFETPRMDQHVSSRIYTRYSSSKYPGGDFNGLGNMPYAVFIRGGFAIHGTPRGNWRLLGRRASHGCIRLHPSHGATFNRLVRENGNTNVWILVD